MPEVGLVGLAAEYARFFPAFTETPYTFFYFTFLTYLGAYLSDKIKLASMLETEPRLYTALLAMTGGKKSEAMRQTKKFFAGLEALDQEEDEDEYDDEPREAWCQVLPGTGSGEGLAHVMMYKPGPLVQGAGGKTYRRWMKRKHRRTILEVDEMAHLAGKMKLESASLLSILTTLFEGKSWANATKPTTGVAQLRLEDVSLSLITATTLPVWERAFTSQDVNSQGFLNRVWLVPGATKNRVSKPPKLPASYTKLQKKVCALLDKFHAVDGAFEADFTPSAERRWDKWYRTRMVEQYDQRLDGYGFRLGMLLAVSAGKVDFKKKTVTIDDEILDAVFALLEWQRTVRKRYWPLVAENKQAMMEQKIIRYLKDRANGDWRMRREVYRAVNATKESSATFSKALEGLRHEGRIEREEVVRTNARGTERYRFCW